MPTLCPQTPTNRTNRHTPRTSSHQAKHKNQTPHQGRRKNHDFFSGSGSSYVIGKAENTEDDDWDF
ncbi:hypothetical protein QP868_02360 [Brevibacterium sp. UMB1308A]|uniref:hypothetical protein n=1 Tax=Brevibacterium sp. UMB1308A TaxID=3050608 RepID=UPI002550A56C|nr:hypothetical protein [Brevibacterium sp. UMB1308A]MDK8345410.1 hypothetical protein [Brevibacterium sp. UMB1308B]MDK8712742.1 hypothetical protein [Brevibacterium sp. UMB1308A]